MITWGIHHKLKFAWGYLWAKIALLWQVRHPRREFLRFELRYSLTNLVNSWIAGALPPALYDGPPQLNFRDGSFVVRPHTHDAALVSPAFERPDFQELRRRLSQVFRTHTGKPVLFVDVGANIGAFSVRMAREFRSLQVLACEPATSNLQWLKKNVYVNGLDGDTRFGIVPYAISSQRGTARLHTNPNQPGDNHIAKDATGEEIETRTLDELLKRIQRDTLLFLKMDVEGHESAVLAGLEQTLARGFEIWLCIEDMFHREALSAQLNSLGFEFVTKKTPYNSWWRRPGTHTQVVMT